MKILVVEDEPKVASFIRQGLEEEGYFVDVAYDGQIGLRCAQEKNYDLLVLDLNLPFVNGLQLCREIRKAKPETLILMLTAMGSTNDVVSGLDAGADDYLVKPFKFMELLARIRALYRRGQQVNRGSVIKIADMEINLIGKTVVRAGKNIQLTAREFSLLVFLAQNEGQVLSRTTIAEKVWEIDFDTGTNLIDVYISYLRNKIDKNFGSKLIHTVVGMGYVLRVNEDD